MLIRMLTCAVLIFGIVVVGIFIAPSLVLKILEWVFYPFLVCGGWLMGKWLNLKAKQKWKWRK